MSNFINDPVSLAGLISLSNNMPFGNALVAAATQTRQNELVNLEQQKLQQAQLEKQKMLEQQQRMQELLPQIVAQLDLDDIAGTFQKLSQIMPPAEAARVLSQLAKARPQDAKTKQSILFDPNSSQPYLVENTDGKITKFNTANPGGALNFEGQLTAEDLGKKPEGKKMSLEEKYPLAAKYRPERTNPLSPVVRVDKEKRVEQEREENYKKSSDAHESLKRLQAFEKHAKNFNFGALADARIAAAKLGSQIFNQDFGVNPAAGEVLGKISKDMAGLLARQLEGGNNRITDNIVEYSLARVPNTGMEDEAVKTLLRSFENSFQTILEYPKAFDFYVNTFGDRDGFTPLWHEYLDTLGDKIIDKRKPTFKDFLQGKMKPDLSGISIEELKRIGGVQ